MAFNEDDERQWQSGASQVVFCIGVVQHQPNKLYREADPEEEIELDEAEEDLVVGVHGLDASVGTKELVDLPAKLGVYLPSEGAVCELRDGDNNGNDHGQYVYRDV